MDAKLPLLSYEAFLTEATNVKCKLCGCRLAESREGLEAHMKKVHGVSTLPKKYRPKSEIVNNFEIRNSKHFISLEPDAVFLDEAALEPEPVVEVAPAPIEIVQPIELIEPPKEHDIENCACSVCWNFRLDRLVVRTQEALDACGTDSSVNNDLASDQL